MLDRPGDPPKQARIYLCVFLFAIVVVLLFWQVVPFTENGENTDYLVFYGPVARSLAAGKGLTQDGSRVAVRYPPGHPLLLAGVFKLADTFSLSSQTALSLFTLFCYGLSAVLIYALGRGIRGFKLGLAAAGVWITYPPLVWLTTEPSSEIPFLALFYLSLCFFLFPVQRQSRAWHWYLLSGLCSGLATLIRPAGLAIGFGMALSIGMILRAQTLKLRVALIALLALGNLIAIVPWQTFVYLKTGRIILVSTAMTPALRDGLRFAVNPKWYRRKISVPEDVRDLSRRIHARAEELVTTRQVLSVVAEESRTSPMALLKLVAIKAARSWYATDSGRRENVLLPLQAFYLALIAIGGYRAWRSGGTARSAAIAIGSVTICFWAMTIMVLSILRYMTPVIGLSFALLPGIFAPSQTAKGNARPSGE